jgi:hypothetical protein
MPKRVVYLETIKTGSPFRLLDSRFGHIAQAAYRNWL